MITDNEAESHRIYDSSDLTAEQQLTLAGKCNDAWARKELRRLRFLILFAQSEPETIPVYDEDTGEIGSKPNYGPTNVARRFAEEAMQCSFRSPILTRLGWTADTPYADWQTLLRLLPVEHLQPLPWPGK